PSPSQPEPEPPKLPDPTPGEPDPIPKKLVIIPATPSRSATKKTSESKNKKKSPDGGAGGDEGQSMPGPTSAPTVSPRTTPPPAPRPSGEAGQPREGSNAIYKMDKDGLVTEIFRQPVLVLSMIDQEGTLLVGTGSDGLIYQIDPEAQETIVL